MPSTGRVLSLAVVIPIMIVWTVLCIKKGDFIIPDQKIVALVISAIGGKTIQSFIEAVSIKPAPAAPAVPTPPAP